MLDLALSIDISHGQSYTRQMRAVVVSLWRHIVQMKANLYTNPVTPILIRHVAVITQRDMTFYLNPNILVFVFHELRIVRVIWRRVLNRILLIREVCNYILHLLDLKFVSFSLKVSTSSFLVRNLKLHCVIFLTGSLNIFSAYMNCSFICRTEIFERCPMMNLSFNSNLF